MIVNADRTLRTVAALLIAGVGVAVVILALLGGNGGATRHGEVAVSTTSAAQPATSTSAGKKHAL